MSPTVPASETAVEASYNELRDAVDALIRRMEATNVDSRDHLAIDRAWAKHKAPHQRSLAEQMRARISTFKEQGFDMTIFEQAAAELEASAASAEAAPLFDAA